MQGFAFGIAFRRHHPKPIDQIQDPLLSKSCARSEGKKAKRGSPKYRRVCEEERFSDKRSSHIYQLSTTKYSRGRHRRSQVREATWWTQPPPLLLAVGDKAGGGEYSKWGHPATFDGHGGDEEDTVTVLLAVGCVVGCGGKSTGRPKASTVGTGINTKRSGTLGGRAALLGC